MSSWLNTSPTYYDEGSRLETSVKLSTTFLRCYNFPFTRLLINEESRNEDAGLLWLSVFLLILRVVCDIVASLKFLSSQPMRLETQAITIADWLNSFLHQQMPKLRQSELSCIRSPLPGARGHLPYKVCESAVWPSWAIFRTDLVGVLAPPLKATNQTTVGTMRVVRHVHKSGPHTQTEDIPQ